MFTGLIEALGDVAERVPVPSGVRLRIRAPFAAEIRPGDSVSVNGVCLTAAACDDGQMTVDVGPETMRVTTLGNLVAGRQVNLERSMRADGRFGGHFVQGHIDGAGIITGIRGDGESHWITISLPGELEPFVIPKGSIAVDGISLTVARLGERSFEVMIIPYTWTQTTLASLRVGDQVNLECDMVGKYVARSLALSARSGHTT